MTFLCDNPWIFHRDEIDLLEEELDELYRLHEPIGEDSVSQMEDRILKEQLDTEEFSEAELTLQIGPDYLLPHTHLTYTDANSEDESLIQSLRDHAYRDPLYARIYAWAKRAFVYASTRYLKEGVREEAVFRVYINAKIIPIKFVAAQTERLSGDSIGEQIAKKEGSLCLTYFERTLTSLEYRSMLGDEEATILLQDGRELERLSRLHVI
jgi:hypothetical protein